MSWLFSPVSPDEPLKEHFAQKRSSYCFLPLFVRDWCYWWEVDSLVGASCGPIIGAN